MVELLDNCVPQPFLVALIWRTALLRGRLNLKVRLNERYVDLTGCLGPLLTTPILTLGSKLLDRFPQAFLLNTGVQR